MKMIKRQELDSYLGQEIGIGEWFHMDQDRINQFADLTHDHQFIHVDPEMAKMTPFGTTIAHGFLTLSMLTHLSDGCMVGVEGAMAALNYGFDKVRFMAPVKVGSDLRARGKLLSCVDKNDGKRLLMTYEMTIEIKGEEKPACVAHWLFMILMP